MNKNQHIVIYKQKDNSPTIDVRLEKDTIWLNQQQLSLLFETERSVITKHINNIYKTGELKRSATCAKNCTSSIRRQ